jgi:sugar lactone lactonase YvrE
MTLDLAKLHRPARYRLAEGPVWHDGQLWLVDIPAGELHRLGDESVGDRSWAFGDCLAAAAPSTDGRWILVLRDEIACFDPATGAVTPLARLPDVDSICGSVRFNDGKCDRFGRLWVGTMALDRRHGSGALYCVGDSREIRLVLPEITLSNGLGWSPDDTRFYYVDSRTRRIDCFIFDGPQGRLGARTVLAGFGQDEGLPDGLAVDSQGDLWVALWGGGCVWKLDGRTGERIGRISIPASQVSSCAFGGRNLTTLFITTAVEGLSDLRRQAEPYAGAIFSFEVSVPGLATNRFRFPAPGRHGSVGT